ncbi:hypothetical protein YC2023_007705 [Brassica napus]|uniref:Uncharacterized protein n=2 Tax=Brassica TaxID=3705 RepID=A0A3P6G246_BRAOL|nr:unnamed protein product [Brassica oleracea]
MFQPEYREIGEKVKYFGFLSKRFVAMLLYIPTPGEAIDDKFSKYFSKPAPLLSRFSYPKLLSLKDEEAKRVKHAKQITNPLCLSG